MDLDALRAFIAVADTGSFSAAAKSLDFARTTLRRQIDELEARNGVQLLKRAADGVSMTGAGELLARKGRSLLGDTKTVFDALRALEMQDDLIVVEVPFGQSPSLEQTAHATFRRAAPNLRWRVRYTDGKFNPASESAFVLHVGPPENGEQWESTRIAKVKVGLLASSSYLEKRGEPETVEELKQHDLLVWERHDREPGVLPVLGGEGDKNVIRPKLVSPSAHTLRHFAVSGEGIALAPTSQLAAFLDSGEKPVRVLKDAVEDEVEVWFSARKGALSGPLGVLAASLTKLTRTAFGVLG